MAAQPDRPNILLITTDQQRFDTFGRWAPPYLRTPHLDHLAADGVTFTAAYADCPVCVPGRAAIMTGQSVYRHGMGTNAPTCDYFGSADTLAGLVKSRGYHTCGIGKLHFHPQTHRHGFDQTITLGDYYRQMRRSGHELQPRRHGLGENELYAGMATVPESMTLTSWTTEQAVEWLRERRDPQMPWFCWVSYSKPHPPLDPPEPYYSMYRNCEIEKPWMADWATDRDRPTVVRRHQFAHDTMNMPWEILRETKAAYYGLITQIDYNIGRLVGAIQDTGPFFNPNDNTLILFASDHGELLGDHGMGAKDSLHEGSAHVPMLLRLPRTWKDRPQGAEVDSVVCLQDILPTFVHAAGGQTPEDRDGQDLVALATGALAEPRRYLLCGQGFNQRAPENIQWAGVTDGRWKYAWYYGDGREQMFDLADDPHELHDLAQAPEHQATKRELRAETIRQLQAHGGRYLQDGELYSRDEPIPTDDQLRSRGFPGFMADDHPSDALH